MFQKLIIVISENFLNRKRPELQSVDVGVWWETLKELQRMLRLAARTLHSNGVFNDQQLHNYLMSVTEREVRLGCLNVKNVKDHVIVYTRIINSINMQHIKRAGAFVDLGSGAVRT